VYKAGFATSQNAQEEGDRPLLDTLDWLEARVSQQRGWPETAFTEADICLFTTLIHFDAVYVGHFKCNLRRIADYPALSAYVRNIYQRTGVAGTVDSHRPIKTQAIASLTATVSFIGFHCRSRVSPVGKAITHATVHEAP
jgi:putative glutathione S-transferase